MKKSSEKYRPVPFWAWNGQMTEEKIREHLHKIKEGGFGGVFVHPRPGLTVPYLSDEWFSLWKAALAEAKKLGLKLYIYDENTYPTGYAGGHVMSEYPDCAARSVKIRCFRNGKEFAEYQNNEELPEEVRVPLKVYETEESKDGVRIIRDLTEMPKEEQYLTEGALAVLAFQTPYASAWYGGFPNPDLLRPEVTKELLDSTYEMYFKYFGEDFGTWIPAIFSDEPGISPGSVYLDDPMAFPYSSYFAYQFYQRYGYSLEDHMAAICLNIEKMPDGVSAEKVRYDYYCLIRELWIENFAKPIHEWCEEHSIAWTGHFLDEHWPCPWGCASPAIMSMYEWMDWPGIDMLMTHMLKKDGKSPMLLSVKELQSAGAQLGKERLLCECFGAGGWDASIADFKRIGDWLAVNGINLFNPHLILDSVSGVRKTGHPQSFDWREPWWKEYQILNEYFTRLSKIMTEGKRKAEILLLHPTTTWFLKRPAEVEGNILWDYEKMNDDSPIKTYIGKIQQWTEAGMEFDLGDEFLIEKYGMVQNGKLCVGEACYSMVYIPKEMKHIRSATKQLLEHATDQGVRIMMEEESVVYMDGEVQSSPVLCFPLCGPDQMIRYAVKKGTIPVVTSGSGITVSRRVLEGGVSRFFFINSTPQKRYLHTALEGKTVRQIDLFGDALKPYPYKQKDNNCEVEISLESGGSLLLESRIDNSLSGTYEKDNVKLNSACSTADNVDGRISLPPISVRLEGDNVLTLDYGNLLLRGRWQKEIYVQEACRKIYAAHGYDKNPWDMAIQYRDRIIAGNSFPPDSGFLFEYPFVNRGFYGPLYAVVEHPELCQVMCNGMLLSQCTDKVWLDDEFGIYEIPEAVLQEQNVLSVKAVPFDVCMELQPVYLLGNFSLRPAEKGFEIVEEQTLNIGGLCTQGVYFYPGRVIYAFVYIWDGSSDFVSVELGKYEVSALTLQVNGCYAGMAGTGTGDRWEISPYLRKGENEIIIELSCSLKNLFGPHHTPEPVRNSAWPNAWKMAPVYCQPAGKKYDCIDYGLKENILIKTGQNTLNSKQNR